MDEENLSVQTYLEEVTPGKRRRDAETLLELMTRVTGESPRLWSSVIGFGHTTTSTRAVARETPPQSALQRVEPPRQSICPTA